MSLTVPAGAQEIYKWTDENGNLHFGTAPAGTVKGLQAENRKKSAAELECEVSARRDCGREIEARNPSGDALSPNAMTECVEEHLKTCASLSKPTPKKNAK